MTSPHRNLALAPLVTGRGTLFGHWMDSKKAYTAAEAEFLPAALELIERPVSPTARLTGMLLVSFVALVCAWALLARVDIVVKAPGKLILSGRTKSIASVDTGSVRQIHVHEGQSVRAGDVLIELDAGVFEADEHKAQAELRAALLEIARSRALIKAIDSDRRPVLSFVGDASDRDLADAKAQLLAQYGDFLAKRTELDGQIERYARALPLAQERARRYASLSETHDVSASASSEKLQSAIELEGQLTQARNARMSLIAETRRRALDTLSDAEKIAASSSQDAARAISHARLLTLRAPVDGYVQQLSVHAIGSVVAAAQPVMLIVPHEDHLEVEAWIENRDIGFVHEGQPASVKIDAFDYTKHGMAHGNVALVSKDAVDDEKRGPLYKTLLKLNSAVMRIDGHDVSLGPGMAVNVEIRTGSRRVVEYLLSPILRYEHESLNER